MDYRTLELNIVSAKDVKNVNRFTKMHVYAVVSIIGDPMQNQRANTPLHRQAGDSPTWNFPVQFIFNETLAKQNRLTLFIQLFSHRSILGDKEIGSVRVSVNELLDRAGDGKSLQHMNYDVRKPSGKAKGILNISYKFGEAFTRAPSAEPKGEPTIAYPPPHAGASSMPYPPPPPQHGAPYGYPPPPPYGGYPPTQAGYGYPAQPGYGYPQVQQPARRNQFGMGMGTGLLGGALGGLLIGDMISDAGAYDAGYDAGFDDGGGFDF